MPAAVAVSGRARVVSAWLNLVERLGCGTDDQLAAAWPHRSVQELEGRSATGPAVRGRRWPCQP
jgi:hypothetical protein